MSMILHRNNQIDLESIIDNERSILSRIGNTPLIALSKLTSEYPEIEIYAKAEWFNPGGSVKDRAALQMIRQGIESGALTPDKIILDATSGNTGIAYAMIGAALGYRVKIVMPGNASTGRKQILRAYGAQVVLTDPLEGTDGAQQRVKAIVDAQPDIYFYPDQYNNDANWRAHYETTAKEILWQTDGRITHFIAGIGTSGTFTGVTRRLKKELAYITCVAVQPDSPLHGIEGWKHMPTSIVPGIYDPSIADLQMQVTTDEAYEFVRRLARDEGLLVGVSSGAAMAAAMKLAASIQKGVIVTIFPDSAEKYFHEPFWKEESL